MATAAYPRIPTLSAPEPTEGPGAYGSRAFRFLVTEGLSACTLDTPTLDLAYCASQVYVTAPDCSDVARARFHAIRLDMLQTLARRAAETVEAEQWRALAATHTAAQVDDDDDHRDGGTKVPTHPTPPTAPAAPALTPPRLPAGVKAF